MAREAREEVGVGVDPDLLRLVATVHHRQYADLARLGLFFLTDECSGEPVNAEPHKCGRLVWSVSQPLPSKVIAFPAAGIETWLQSESFAPHGWSPAT